MLSSIAFWNMVTIVTAASPTSKPVASKNPTMKPSSQPTGSPTITFKPTVTTFFLLLSSLLAFCVFLTFIRIFPLK